MQMLLRSSKQESIRNTAEQRKQAIQNNDDATNEEKEVANQPRRSD